jgi:GT2 family glycosyltransferase
VCDDGSSDGTSEHLSDQYPEVMVIKGDGNLWWTGATNACVKYILSKADRDDYIVTLNNDLELSVDYLEKMAEALASRPQIIQTSASYDICKPTTLVDPGQRIDWLRGKEYRLNPNDHNYSGLAEVTHAPGRGTVFPVPVFHQIGLYDFDSFPHYAADNDFTLRARRLGYRIFINYDSKLYSHISETGSIKYSRHRSFSSVFDYLTNIKSPACLKYRWRFAIKNCPRLFLPSFIIIDTARVIGSYLIHNRKSLGFKQVDNK